jgi:hypothetical protein
MSTKNANYDDIIRSALLRSDFIMITVIKQSFQKGGLRYMMLELLSESYHCIHKGARIMGAVSWLVSSTRPSS